MIFEHERVVIEAGARSGVPIVVAIHSTQDGPALGGCRMTAYPDVGAALRDALDLSRAMTRKCAAAGLPMGGGKTVVMLPSACARRDVLLDVGDVIESLGGTYITGPDLGTGPDDMAVIGTRTRHVLCRPPSHGGSGDSSPHTAASVLAAIAATTPGPRRVAIVGLGAVGLHLARSLTGVSLVVADVDSSKRPVAEALGAQWVSVAAALESDVDILVPAATGGMITADLVPRLRCRAIIGPANNQLASDDVALLLRERGIVWVPDHLASAGGIIHAVAVELLGESEAQVARRIAALFPPRSTLSR